MNVNLSNVLNNLALDLKIDKSNIPINAQIPVTVAANVCGVSINILSIGAGGGSSQGCTANSISPELKQYIQQQIAAAGNVGGGAHLFFGDNVGIRGDIRYFRGLQNDEDDGLDLNLTDFDFWRGTVGVTFRFGG